MEIFKNNIGLCRGQLSNIDVKPEFKPATSY